MYRCAVGDLVADPPGYPMVVAAYREVVERLVEFGNGAESM
jgi:hypothetical protein